MSQSNTHLPTAAQASLNQDLRNRAGCVKCPQESRDLFHLKESQEPPQPDPSRVLLSKPRMPRGRNGQKGGKMGSLSNAPTRTDGPHRKRSHQCTEDSTFNLNRSGCPFHLSHLCLTVTLIYLSGGLFLPKLQPCVIRTSYVLCSRTRYI